MNAGLRVTAVGGSDNHNPDSDPAKASAVGYPTTVVHDAELSQPAILAAIRGGHVFVDVTGSRNRLLEVTAASGGKTAEMGDALAAARGAPIQVTVRVTHAAGGSLAMSSDGAKPQLTDAVLAGDNETRSLVLGSYGARHWLRFDVRGPDGKLWLLGNPIYLNAP